MAAALINMAETSVPNTSVAPVAPLQVEEDELPMEEAHTGKTSIIRENYETWDTAKTIVYGLWFQKETLMITISIILYFGVSIAVYSSMEGWDFMECLYFSIVVVTTVGYGDFLPTKDESKIATIILSQLALAIVAFAIGNLVDVVQQTFMQLMKITDNGLGVFNHDEMRRRRKKRSLIALIIYLVIVLLGTIVFGLWQDWGDDQGNKWVNALYLTVITMTTIGFGDHSPNETHGMKMFGVFLMLVGIPAMVTVLALTTEIVFGSNRDAIRLRVVRGSLTQAKWKGLHKFVQDMREQGIGNYRQQGRNRISRFEYLCFILVQNEVLQLENIKNVMKNFDSLDTRHSGYLEFADVEQVEESENQSDMALTKTMADIVRRQQQGVSSSGKEEVEEGHI